MNMRTERVSFGYRRVSAPEKRRLVSEQFDAIAENYDRADTVLSAGRDARWRRKALACLRLDPGETVLDVCGGTGGLALLAAAKTGPEGRVIVFDFNREMMKRGRARVERSPFGREIAFLQGDAESLAVADGSVDAVTVGFGLRNFVSPAAGLGEIYRVLRHGGRLLVLEFSVPRRRLLRLLYHFYSFRIMPLIARLICGTGEPHRYLAESIRVFPPPESVVAMIGEAGFSGAAFRRLTGGIAVIYTATKD